MLSSMVPQLRGNGALGVVLGSFRSSGGGRRHEKLLEAGAGKDYWNFGGETP